MTRQRTGLLLALTCLLLAGCSGSTTVAVATATSTRAPLPTVTPSPSPAASATTLAAQPCSQSSPLGGYGVVQEGDLLVRFIFGFAYPARQLPGGLPLKPYQFSTQPPIDPAVNPSIADPTGGFDVTICNAGAATHTVSTLGLTIQGFTAYTGSLNTWNVCSTTYTRQSGATGGGCGGGLGDPNCLLATFPASASTGATALTTTTSCTQQTLPLTLKPGDAYYANLGAIMPTVPGTYTLALTFTADGAAPVSVPLTDPILLAPVSHNWDGNACTTTAMQSQIPTTNPTTPYICPIS